MFTCDQHGWSSFYYMCPICNPVKVSSETTDVAVPVVAQETEDLNEAMELLITDYEELVNKLYPKKDRQLYLPCLQRARKSLHKSIQRRKQ